MRTTSRFLALVVVILSFGLPTSTQAQRKTDAQEILNSTFKVYSRLASYQDEGVVIATEDQPHGGTIQKMPFKTFFKRPNMFRFEWTDFRTTKLGRTRLTWSNGKEAFTYWEPDHYEKEESLDLAVAGATGITFAAAVTIPDLVLPDQFHGPMVKELVNVSLLGEEVFEGVLCYRLSATYLNDPIELWIGKNDFLLRKIRRDAKEDDTLFIREEIRRKIQVDQSIPEVVFDYKPPIPLTPRADTATGDMSKLIDPGPPVWSEFRSDKGRFTVLMPEKPASQASTVETPQGRVEEHAFVASHGALVYTVGYTDMPKQSPIANDVDGFIDDVRDQFIKELEGKLASESSISLDGHPGREIKAQLFRGELRVRVFLVGERVYILSVIKLDKVSESDGEAFNKFFGSFKLTPIAKPIAALLLRQQKV